MNNALNRTVTTRSLIKFALPTILTMLFMSAYSMTDGIFVARLINTAALSAVNIVMPIIMLSLAVGTMLAAGGSAIVAKKMGEGKDQEARENFSLLIVAAVISSVILSALGFIFISPLVRLLGANDAVYDYCIQYAKTTLLFLPTSMFAMFFQIFFITAGKAALGTITTIIGGIVTVALDYICIALLDMGIAGAAVSTGVGYAIPGLLGLCYFIFNRKGSLYLLKPKLDRAVLFLSCTNGASEMVTVLSQSVITVLFNNVLMRMAGENGVAAITIILYAQGLLNSAFMGYATGIAPIISYNYGKQDYENQRKTYSISKRVIFLSSSIAFVAGLVFASPLVSVFTSTDSPVYAMAVHGFRIFSFCFLFMGMSIYGSAMFTALSNGKVSAIISFMRSLVFVIATVLLLPLAFGLNGVWLAIPVAEALGVIVTIHYVQKLKGTYRYA